MVAPPDVSGGAAVGGDDERAHLVEMAAAVGAGGKRATKPGGGIRARAGRRTMRAALLACIVSV
jgi:hypothetical protein